MKASSELKKRVIEEYRKKKEEEKLKEQGIDPNNKDVKEDIEQIVDNIIDKKKIKEVNSDSTDVDENEDDDEIDLLKKNVKLKITENELDAYYNDYEKSTVPYFYIDYNDDTIQQAKNIGYQTLKVEKGGLTKKLITAIATGELFDLKKTHLIINFWRVITKSNLNTYTQECSSSNLKKFKNKFETTYKWGSKIYLKDKLDSDEQKEYSLIRDGVLKLFKFLYSLDVKIFIVCNSHYSFVKTILEHYKLDKYIEALYTPSKCGLPSGKIVSSNDVFKDGRKINRDRVFACIERYVGRLPIKDRTPYSTPPVWSAVST
jgi:phosphoserine phosphatase